MSNDLNAPFRWKAGSPFRWINTCLTGIALGFWLFHARQSGFTTLVTFLGVLLIGFGVPSLLFLVFRRGTTIRQ